MSQANLGSFKPLLPFYLSVRDLKIINQSPYTFSLRVGSSPSTIKEISLTGEALCLLSLADGTRTAEQIYTEVTSVNPQLSIKQYEEILNNLLAERLIVDSSDDSLLPSSSTDRYQRHLLYYLLFHNNPQEVQSKLQKSTVAVLGMGGIGTWLAYLLASAGVGTLHLIDGDQIETSNLTRQVLYNSHDVGKLKVEVARERLLAINPDIKCLTYPLMIQSKGELKELLSSFNLDMMLVSADRPEILRDWVDEYSVEERIPWSSAGYADALGICGPLMVPGKTGCRACQVKDFEPHDRLESFPLVGDINRRFQPPSFGPLNGVVASILAKEAITWLGGLEPPPPSLGATVFFDAATLSSNIEQWKRREDCPRCKHLF